MTRTCLSRARLLAYRLLPLMLVACGPTAGGPDAGTGSDGDGDVAIDAAILDAGGEDAGEAPDAEPGTPTDTFAYYFGDFETEGDFQVARMDLGSGERTILPLSGLSGGADISGIALSPDNGLLVVADVNTAGGTPQLQLYPADGSGTPTTLFAAADASRSITTPSFSPDGDWVAFLTDSELVGAKALHVVPIDASAVAKRVSLPPVAANQDVATFAWSPDSLNIAFVGDLVSNNVDALWTVNATAISPTTVEIVSTAELGSRDVGRGVSFDASGRLYFRGDFELADNQFRLYRSNLDGSGRSQLAGTALTNGNGEAAIGNFEVSPDGLRIAFASDSPTADLYQVYVLDLATTAPALISNLSTAAPTSGLRGPNFFEPLAWSPDGSQLTLAADWPVGTDVDNDFGVFVLSTVSGPGGLRLCRPAVASGDAFAPTFSSDGSKIVFRGDMLVSNQSDLHVVDDLATSDQDASTIRSDESPVGGSIRGFVVTN